jgi:acyl carrier protein
MNDDERLATMRKRVQRLVFLAAGGRIAEQDLAAAADLREIGLDSLGYLNLIEGLERTFQVAIDLDHEEDHSFLHTIDGIVQFLAARQASAP